MTEAPSCRGTYRRIVAVAVGVMIAAYCLLIYDWFHESAGLPPLEPLKGAVGMARLWLFGIIAICAVVAVSMSGSGRKHIIKQQAWNKSDFATISLLLAASLLCRLSFLMRPYSIFTADDAMIGLMAQDIGAGKPAPIFYYGQSYLGTLLPHLLALLPVGWMSATALMAVNWSVYAAFEIIFYLLVLRLVGRAVAVVSGLYLAVSPFALTESILSAGCAISETLLLSVVMLWLAFLIAQRPAPRPYLISALGAVAGFSIYIRSFAILIILAILAFFLIFRRNLIRLRLLGLFAGGFALGYLPAILYELGTGFGHLSSVVDQTFARDSGITAGITARMSGISRFTLPIMLGARFRVAERPLNPLLAAVLGVLFIVGCAWLIRHLIIRARRADASIADKFILVFIVLLLLVPFVLVLMTPDRLALAHRYIDVAYISIAFLFGLGIAALFRRSKPIAVAIAVLVLTVNVVSSHLYACETRYISDRYRGFVSMLEEFGIHHVSSSYWCSTLTTFVTDRQTVCAADVGPSKGDRIRELTEEVGRAKAPAFAFMRCSMRQVLTRYLESRGISYDFRETLFPIWFNLGRKVRPEEVGLFPMVAVNLPSPHNNAMCKRTYTRDDDIICKVLVIADKDDTQCDLIAALRDDTGRVSWLPEGELSPYNPTRLELDRGRVHISLIELKVREVPALANVTRDTEFEFIAGLAEPGSLEFHDRIHSQWFFMKPHRPRCTEVVRTASQTF